MIKLKDIANIRTGSPDFKANSGNEIRMVRMKNINHPLCTIEWDETDSVNEGIRPVKYLAEGDVLIVAKGERNTAVVVSDLRFNAVASNHFFILSIDPSWQNKLRPEFLAWYINFPGKAYLQANSAGAVIPNLRKGTLENLELNLPTINDQNWVTDVFQTMLDQRRVFEELFNDRITLLSNKVLK